MIIEYQMDELKDIVERGNYSGEYIRLKDLYAFLIKTGDITYDYPYEHNVGFSLYKMAFSKSAEIVPNAYNILSLIFYHTDVSKQLIKEADIELEGVEHVYVMVHDKGKTAVIGACDGVALYEKKITQHQKDSE